ncbi:MAG: hypothetical protein JW795_21095 [Chitinivibrionales bacterium]|nr:hypothetical protein [Chitinivibrionales bacterium]
MVSQKFARFCEVYNAAHFQEAAEFAGQQAGITDNYREFWLMQQAKALSKAGDYCAAFEAADQAVQIAPTDRFCHCARADAAVKVGKLDEALAEYAELLNDPQLSARAQSRLLNCVNSMPDKSDQILQFFDHWQKPQSETFAWKVRALVVLKRHEEAHVVCQQWRALFPDDPETLAQIEELENDLDTGAESAVDGGQKTAATTHGDAAAPTVRMQAFLLVKDGKEQEALPLFEELLRLNPKDNFVHNSYVAAVLRIPAAARADAFYAELIKRYPDEKLLCGRARKIQQAMTSI